MSKTFSSLNIGGIIYKVKDKSSISTPASQGLPGQVLVVSKNGTTEWKSIESIDSSIGLITTSLNKIDSSVRTIDSSVRSIDSSVSNLDTSISKIDSSVNELNNKMQRLDSSIGEIISNLDNREQGEDVLEEYNLVLDSSIHLIKVFTPYNCEWNLEVLPATSDEILWSQHKDNIVHSFLVERFGDNYDDSLYIINIDNNSKTYIDKEANEMFLETIETSIEFIVKYCENYNTIEYEYRINKEETINDEKKNPFNISSYFGISSTYITYSIDKSLEQKYYARDYILQLKCKNEIKKTIELYIENSYTDADYYDILLPSNTLLWSENMIPMRIISPTEWRIQEAENSGFTDIYSSSGVGSQNIILSYGSNDNITPRQTTLELYSLPDKILRKTLTITQLGKPENVYTDADYDIRLSNTLLPYSKGKTFIQIISPTEWRIQETVSSGFTNISPNYGAGSQNITLSYDNNDNITPRETTLELYSLPDEILRKSLKITQSAKPA